MKTKMKFLAAFVVTAAFLAGCSGASHLRESPLTIPISGHSTLPTWILSLDGPGYAGDVSTGLGLVASLSVDALRNHLFDVRSFARGRPACSSQTCWPGVGATGGNKTSPGPTVFVAMKLWLPCAKATEVLASQLGHTVEFVVSQKYVCPNGAATAAEPPLALIGIRPNGPLASLTVSVRYVAPWMTAISLSAPVSA